MESEKEKSDTSSEKNDKSEKSSSGIDDMKIEDKEINEEDNFEKNNDKKVNVNNEDTINSMQDDLIGQDDFNPSLELDKNDVKTEISQQDIDVSIQSCSDKDTKADDEPEWEDVLGSGALMKKILKRGTADLRPQRLDICTINYKCYLENSKEVDEEENVDVQMGDLEVIQGIDVALALMNVGEKSILKIEPRLAYGAKGLDTKIPPNTTVFYEIELTNIQPEVQIDTLTIEQRSIKGNMKRKRGNWWYGRGECTFAIQCYRRALDYLDEVEGSITFPITENSDPTLRSKNDSALQNLMEDRISVSNNMAAAQIKLEAYDAALQSLQIVLRCQPHNVKALFRKAKILKLKGDVNESLKCLQKAQMLEPDNATIQKEMQDINNLLKKHKSYEKELAKRMLSTSKTNIEADDKSDSNPNTTKTVIWTSIALSVIIGIASIAAWKFKFS